MFLKYTLFFGEGGGGGRNSRKIHLSASCFYLVVFVGVLNDAVLVVHNGDAGSDICVFLIHLQCLVVVSQCKLQLALPEETVCRKQTM